MLDNLIEFILLMGCGSIILTQEVPYQNFKILRVEATKPLEIDLLLNETNTHLEDYDVWIAPTFSQKFFLLSASPMGYKRLSVISKQFNMSIEIVHENLNKLIMDQKRENHLRKVQSFYRTGHSKSYYKNYEEILLTLNRLSQFRSMVKVETFGHTFEGRPLQGVLISLDDSKPIIWIDAGIHAREWIAPAAALSLIAKLIRPSGRQLLENFQFYIVPVVNPDGYQYTHREYRLWRKNRAPTEGELCLGTDLNRNYPFKWGVGNGASPHSCSDTYRGSRAASELETQYMIEKLKHFKGKIILYLSLHSFGQYILTPYGFSRYNYPPTYERMRSMGEKVKDAILYRHGYVYQVGASSELLYEASGATDDYVIGELNVTYAYTIELCDEGRYGFLLPPSYIGQVGRQLWTAVNVFAQNIA